MVNISRKTIALLAISTGTMLAITCSLPLNAQTKISQSGYLEDIQAGKDEEWNFSGVDESLSIEDEIQELGEYRISEPQLLDLEATVENNKWGDERFIERYYLEAEIYEY